MPVSTRAMWKRAVAEGLLGPSPSSSPPHPEQVPTTLPPKKRFLRSKAGPSHSTSSPPMPTLSPYYENDDAGKNKTKTKEKEVDRKKKAGSGAGTSGAKAKGKKSKPKKPSFTSSEENGSTGIGDGGSNNASAWRGADLDPSSGEEWTSKTKPPSIKKLKRKSKSPRARGRPTKKTPRSATPYRAPTKAAKSPSKKRGRPSRSASKKKRPARREPSPDSDCLSSRSVTPVNIRHRYNSPEKTPPRAISMDWSDGTRVYFFRKLETGKACHSCGSQAKKRSKSLSRLDKNVGTNDENGEAARPSSSSTPPQQGPLSKATSVPDFSKTKPLKGDKADVLIWYMKSVRQINGLNELRGFIDDTKLTAHIKDLLVLVFDEMSRRTKRSET